MLRVREASLKNTGEHSKNFKQNIINFFFSKNYLIFFNNNNKNKNKNNNDN